MRLEVGDTFKLISATDDDHLWIVIGRQDDRMGIVNFTSRKAGKDESCLIQRGEHPLCTHDTVVEYGRAKVLESEQTNLLELHGISQRFARIDADLLRRIQHGALASDFSSGKLQELVKKELR